MMKKLPEKRVKTNDKEYLEQMEEWFSEINFNDPSETAYGFGTWLILFFEVWSPMDGTWIDADDCAYTTEELFTEFITTYNK